MEQSLTVGALGLTCVMECRRVNSDLVALTSQLSPILWTCAWGHICSFLGRISVMVLVLGRPYSRPQSCSCCALAPPASGGPCPLWSILVSLATQPTPSSWAERCSSGRRGRGGGTWRAGWGGSPGPVPACLAFPSASTHLFFMDV